MGISRRALLLDLLARVDMILRMVSDSWRCAMPLPECEGVWALQKQRGETIRAWYREMEAMESGKEQGKTDEKADTLERRLEVLRNGKDIAETFMRRLCHNGVLNEPFPECRGAWERERDKAELIKAWIQEIEQSKQEGRTYEVAEGKGPGDRRDAGKVGKADGSQPPAGAVEAARRDPGTGDGVDTGKAARGGVRDLGVTPHQPARTAASPRGEASRGREAEQMGMGL